MATCLYCNESFVQRSRSKGLFCSYFCNGKYYGEKRTLDATVKLNCLYCKKEFHKMKCEVRLGEGKYCSRSCVAKANLSFQGRKHSLDSKIKISKSKIGTISPLRGRKRPNFTGVKNPRWIMDRTKLVKRQERNDSAYKEWRHAVWERDEFHCRIGNSDCNGKIEAHHILGWSEHFELRYEINNGITLCHAHHPKKRAEEKRLAPVFQELVSVLKG